jgi:hypothetical protein
MPDTVLALQRALVEAALTPDFNEFKEDPRGFAARQGLGPLDQAAFARFARRLPAYREMVRASLEEPITSMFPVTHAHLQGAGAWPEALDGFLEARVVTSPHYRDIAPAFLGWLVDTGWGQERWPWLLQLAHFELLESLVDRHPLVEAPPGLHGVPSPGDRVVLDPATQVVAYQFAVTEATREAPEPRPLPLQLMAYRDEGGDVHWLDLTPATAALLVRAQEETIATACRALGLASLEEALSLLEGFCRQGAVQGFLRE